MSALRWQGAGVGVSTFAGPEGCNPNSGGRTCVQITATTASYRFVQMTMDDWIDLVCFIRRMDAEGIGITSVQEID